MIAAIEANARTIEPTCGCKLDILISTVKSQLMFITCFDLFTARTSVSECRSMGCLNDAHVICYMPSTEF